MKISSVASTPNNTWDAPDFSAREKAPCAEVDSFKRHKARRPSFLALGLGALAGAAQLRGVGACQGLNPLQQNWLLPSQTWPANLTYGEVLTYLSAGNSGPSCIEQTYYRNQLTDFYEQSFGCAGDLGVGFCADGGDFSFLYKMASCTPYPKYLANNFTAETPLRTLDNCGIMRAQDCIYFLTDTANFQQHEDAFTQALVPTCAGFNPQQSRWTNKNATWSNVTTAQDIIAFTQRCDVGPACGSAFNFAFASFNCSGQAGTLVGQRDLEAARSAARDSCLGLWQPLDQPPTGALIPTNDPHLQSAWDVQFFFTPAGSSQLDAGLHQAATEALVQLRNQHDAAFMWRVGMVSSAVGSTFAILSYLLTTGSIPRKVVTGLGMGYGADALGVAVGGLVLGQPRILATGTAVASIAIGGLCAAYGVAFGTLLNRRHLNSVAAPVVAATNP